MSFGVANGAVLHLGGANITTPSDVLSVGSFLDAGIPQLLDKSQFADKARRDDNGHTIKHAEIVIVSGGATDDPAARTMTDGSEPTTSLGRHRNIGDVITIYNSPMEIFNFKLFNRSGGAMVVEVEVFE